MIKAFQIMAKDDKGGGDNIGQSFPKMAKPSFPFIFSNDFRYEAQILWTRLLVTHRFPEKF